MSSLRAVHCCVAECFPGRRVGGMNWPARGRRLKPFELLCFIKTYLFKKNSISEPAEAYWLLVRMIQTLL